MQQSGMKVRLIELRSLPGPEHKDSPDVPVDYRTYLLEHLNRVDPEKGVTFEAMEKRLELRARLRDAGDTWIISEDEWAELSSALQAQRWIVVSSNIAQFIRDVVSAPSQDGGLSVLAKASSNNGSAAVGAPSS